MEDHNLLPWYFISLSFVLTGGVVDSSSLSSVLPLPVSCEVGKEAVLPCSWKPRLQAPPPCHVRWENPVDAVFEQLGEERFEAEGFEGRMAVPEARLESGDCSLIIRDVQITDTGRYESFMLLDGDRDTKTKVFIQSVQLSVSDHRSHEQRSPGEDLVLDLFTPHSKRVVFQARNSSSWAVLWMRGDDDGQRFQKHPDGEKLTMKIRAPSDEGTYKVVDEHGLTVSTVQLSVRDFPSFTMNQKQDDGSPTGKAARLSASLPLLLSVFVLTLQMFHRAL